MEFVMKLPAAVREMVDALHAHGFAAYLVGGCVRDALMGIEPHDYDITTDALPEEIVGIFGEERCTWYGKAFGTVCVKINGECAEITTFRTEGTYSDGRHPDEVAFAKDVHDDLARRDFTCNAIAYDPRSGLLDPYHGDDDLKAALDRLFDNAKVITFKGDSYRGRNREVLAVEAGTLPSHDMEDGGNQ